MLNHYQTLNVSFSADLAVIKKAYHKISLLHHPDKTVHLPETERAQREHLFKLANVAFEVLSDPHKRKTYDRNLFAGQNRPKTQGSNSTARPPNGHEPSDPRSQYSHRPRPPQQHDYGPPPPPRSFTVKPGCNRGSQDVQGPQGLQRAPLSTHRFSATTLGTPPDFNWFHCELNERSERTTLTYSNWLGWRFSIDIASRYKVISKPVIPEKPSPEATVVRLPLQRKPKQSACQLTDVVIDLRGTPDSKHIVLCSVLIETQDAGLELVIEVMIAPETVQKDAQGPASWKLAYNIEHKPLIPDLKVKVTNLLFYPMKPYFAVLPNGGVPATPYPRGSPMHGIVNKFPGVQIQEPPPDTYCTKEEQSGNTFWRLKAIGLISA